jgi:hypothetical protein
MSKISRNVTELIIEKVEKKINEFVGKKTCI